MWNSIFLQVTLSFVWQCPTYWRKQYALVQSWRGGISWKCSQYLCFWLQSEAAHHLVSFPVAGKTRPLTSCCHKPVALCWLSARTHPSCSLLTRTHLGKAFTMLGHFFHVIKSCHGVMMCLLFKQLKKLQWIKNNYLFMLTRGICRKWKETAKNIQKWAVFCQIPHPFTKLEFQSNFYLAGWWHTSVDKGLVMHPELMPSSHLKSLAFCNPSSG